jgi:hypothetical protein
MEHLDSRRKFIQVCVSVIPSFLGVAFLIDGCHSGASDKGGKTNGPVDCNDLSGISDNDIKARKQFNYVEVSSDKNKTCSLCNLYLPPQEGSLCGGCMLFKGPVHATGSCTYWTQKTDKPV